MRIDQLVHRTRIIATHSGTSNPIPHHSAIGKPEYVAHLMYCFCTHSRTARLLRLNEHSGQLSIRSQVPPVVVLPEVAFNHGCGGSINCHGIWYALPRTLVLDARLLLTTNCMTPVKALRMKSTAKFGHGYVSCCLQRCTRSCSGEAFIATAMHSGCIPIDLIHPQASS